MRFNRLVDWLAWQETLHPSAIDLGLERVSKVYERLPIQPSSYRIITVAGTNGKGSSIAMLEAILLAAGYAVGAYSSPHIYRYNERIHINGHPISDEALCNAFQQVDEARGEIRLTYFEFGTLAALVLFAQAALDVGLLEVGLGGRLDAVNIIDAHIALITMIGLDHMGWLGTDRESIAREKAGIIRQGRPVVYSDPHLPQAIVEQAQALEAPLYAMGEAFHYTVQAQDWSWQGTQGLRQALPHPTLRGAHQLQNCAGVLMILELLANDLPVTQQDVRNGLMSMHIPGRFQMINNQTTILDVAHNPDAAQALANTLRRHHISGVSRAVMGVLQDKDIRGIFKAVLWEFDEWYLTDLGEERGASAAELAQVLQGLDPGISHNCYSQVEQAYAAAQQVTGPNDRIVVFGSFYTVARCPVS